MRLRQHAGLQQFVGLGKQLGLGCAERTLWPLRRLLKSGLSLGTGLSGSLSLLGTQCLCQSLQFLSNIGQHLFVGFGSDLRLGRESRPCGSYNKPAEVCR
jgi:hypothetical protein